MSYGKTEENAPVRTLQREGASVLRSAEMFSVIAHRILVIPSYPEPGLRNIREVLGSIDSYSWNPGLLNTGIRKK